MRRSFPAFIADLGADEWPCGVSPEVRCPVTWADVLKRDTGIGYRFIWAVCSKILACGFAVLMPVESTPEQPFR